MVASVGNVGTVLGVVDEETLGAVVGASVGKQRAEHIVDGESALGAVVGASVRKQRARHGTRRREWRVTWCGREWALYWASWIERLLAR